MYTHALGYWLTAAKSFFHQPVACENVMFLKQHPTASAFGAIDLGLSSGPKVGVDGFRGRTGCGGGCLRGGQDGGIRARTGRHLLETGSFLCFVFRARAVYDMFGLRRRAMAVVLFCLCVSVSSCIRGVLSKFGLNPRGSAQSGIFFRRVRRLSLALVARQALLAS